MVSQLSHKRGVFPPLSSFYLRWMMHNSFPPNEGAFGPFRPRGYIPTTESLGLEERFFTGHPSGIILLEHEIEAGRLRRSIQKRCSYLRWSPDKLEKLLIEFDWFFAYYVKHNNLGLSELFKGDYGHLVITPKIGEPTYSGLYYPSLLLALFSADPDEIGSFLDFQQELFNANPNNGLFLDFLYLHLNKANHELKELVEGIGLQTAREWIQQQVSKGSELKGLTLQSIDLMQANRPIIYEDERFTDFQKELKSKPESIEPNSLKSSTPINIPLAGPVPDREYLAVLRIYFNLLSQPNPQSSSGQPFMDKGLIRLIFNKLTNSDLDSYNSGDKVDNGNEGMGYTIDKKHFVAFLYRARLFWPGKPKKAMTLRDFAQVCLKQIKEWKATRSEESMIRAFNEYKLLDLPHEIDWKSNQVLTDFHKRYYS